MLSGNINPACHVTVLSGRVGAYCAWHQHSRHSHRFFQFQKTIYQLSVTSFAVWRVLQVRVSRVDKLAILIQSLLSLQSSPLIHLWSLSLHSLIQASSYFTLPSHSSYLILASFSIERMVRSRDNTNFENFIFLGTCQMFVLQN